MPNVVRFALSTARDQYISGVGFFRDGILDVDANRLDLIKRARYLVQPYRAAEIGIVDSATPKPTLPAQPVAPPADPYSQYLLPSELDAATAALVGSGGAFDLAQRAAFGSVVDAGTDLAAARPAGAVQVHWKFGAGVDVGAAGVNVVNGQPGDTYFVAASA